ncbi:unnamed protein product [Ilex paraguariensis]|uniref:Uncharacterized protein n=1 Tax=Ilex paraguariensis TaxID=185542 RepID=A0ABC8QX16_9AQUA
MFGAQSTLAFGTPSSTPPSALYPRLHSPPASPQQSSGGFGFSTSFGAVQAQSSPFGQSTLTPGLPFGKAQLTAQMAHVNPLPFSLADRDIQAIVDAYKQWLFSVTEPQYRTKSAGVSDFTFPDGEAGRNGKFKPGTHLIRVSKIFPNVLSQKTTPINRSSNTLLSISYPLEVDGLKRKRGGERGGNSLDWRHWIRLPAVAGVSLVTVWTLDRWCLVWSLVAAACWCWSGGWTGEWIVAVLVCSLVSR